MAAAAEQPGTAPRACEPAVQHARPREQFGRPIGAFQAVARPCAGLPARAETARAAEPRAGTA
ncbi:acyl-CoA dehydrogenase family protein [Streptomyces sp. NPDC058632]|uniref:acyl-CoA dehydrogenase family protein n=1 Tax=unclassified Streptomyces TaxID=2593676 RepID=UPI00365A08F8